MRVKPSVKIECCCGPFINDPSHPGFPLAKDRCGRLATRVVFFAGGEAATYCADHGPALDTYAGRRVLTVLAEADLDQGIAP